MNIKRTKDFDTYVIDGVPVRVICTDMPGDYPVIAITEVGGTYRRKADGTHLGYAPITLAPKRIECERWIVWTNAGFYGAFKDREEAEEQMRDLQSRDIPAATMHHKIDLVDGEVAE